uniref:Uncharacterized protein n=1 Tax=Helianthus annuus TaxID=4232 RepID=A0A251TPD7_HELAN
MRRQILELKPVCSCDEEPVQSKTRSRSEGRSKCKYVFKKLIVCFVKGKRNCWKR